LLKAKILGIIYKAKVISHFKLNKAMASKDKKIKKTRRINKIINRMKRKKGAGNMAVYQIIRMGDDILREQAQEVRKITPNIHKLLDNMADTMYQAQGVGLAAPQIGVSKRVVVIDSGEGLIELINPVIIEKSGEETDQEGCLSIPNYYGDVKRARKVVVQALNRNGELMEYEAEGLMARAFQHEVDHLNGVLFVDVAHKVYDKE